MSHLHVTKNHRTTSYDWDDGKSDLLDRYVNLDTGNWYYTLGRQLAGKPINPNGVTGRKIKQVLSQLGY